MAQENWTRVDVYLSGALVGDDRVLEAALAASVEAGLPQIEVTANQGKFLSCWRACAEPRRSSSSGLSAATRRSGCAGAAR